MIIYQYFKQLSKFLLTLAKISMIFIGLDYLINYKIYSITFNVPQALRAFSIIDKPLSMIESIGMSMIIIPITVIIISFYYPSKIWLQMLSGVFSVGGNLFTLAHLSSKGLLEEYFRTFFFTIYNAPSLEKKMTLFTEFFNTSINKYTKFVSDAGDFQTFVQAEFLNNFNSYVKIIKTTTQLDIIPFASSVADSLHNQYQKHLTLLASNSLNTDVVPNISNNSPNSYMYIIGGVVLVIGGVIVWYKLGEAAKLLEQVGSELLNTTKRITKFMTNFLGISKDLNATINNVEQLTLQVSKINANVASLEESHLMIAANVATNADLFKQAINEIEKMYNELKNLICLQSVEQTGTIISNTINPDIQIIQHQIIALAKSSLTCNKAVAQFSIDLENLKTGIGGILNQTKQQISEAIVKANILPGIENVVNSPLTAADKRWIEQARMQLQQFDAETTLSTLRSKISDLVKPIAEELSTKIQEQIEAAQKTLNDRKLELTKQISTVDKKVQNNTSDITQIKEQLAGQVETTTLQTQANTKLNNDITDIKLELQDLRNGFESLKKLTTDAFNELSNMYKNMEISFKTLSKNASKDLLVMSQTAKLINSDNRDISLGTYQNLSEKYKDYLSKPPSNN